MRISRWPRNVNIIWNNFGYFILNELFFFKSRFSKIAYNSLMNLECMIYCLLLFAILNVYLHSEKGIIIVWYRFSEIRFSKYSNELVHELVCLSKMSKIYHIQSDLASFTPSMARIPVKDRRMWKWGGKGINMSQIPLTAPTHGETSYKALWP